MEKKIFVERETFEFKGNTYFSYFIKGTIRGKEVKLAVIPPDKGGYVVLDIVFDNEMACELVLKPYEMKDDKGNVTMAGNTYSVISVDENGLVYECPVKPAKSSDKALLNMLIR